MPKSNTDGAGRGSYNANRKTVIGDVINHGKKPYWDPAKSHHYHATLRAGEETLEASLVRVSCAPWPPRRPSTPRRSGTNT